jgi:hypothetical protein
MGGRREERGGLGGKAPQHCHVKECQGHDLSSNVCIKLWRRCKCKSWNVLAHESKNPEEYERYDELSRGGGEGGG